jgi:hypothetical protein
MTAGKAAPIKMDAITTDRILPEKRILEGKNIADYNPTL